MDCRIKRTAEWSTRILHELPYWDTASFVTLTYDEEHLPDLEIVREDTPVILPGTLVKKDLINFFRRLKEDRKIKYFACGEYGDETKTMRPHYHAIIFGVHPIEKELILDNWKYGLVDLGTVTPKSAKYVASYIQKKLNGQMAEEKYGGRQPPFQLQSRGIGLQYALDNAERLRQKGFVSLDGHKVGVPRYYQKKLEMTHEDLKKHAQEREQAVVAMLNKEGVKVIRPKVKDAYMEPHRRQTERNTEARTSLTKKGAM